MTHNNLGRRQLIGGAAAGLAFAGNPARAASGMLTIGCLLPLSGDYADHGVYYENGIRTFQALHGASVAGLPVKLVFRDDRGPASGDLSRRMTQELIIREKADVVLGYAFTPNAMSSASVLTEAKVPGVIINAATSAITSKSAYFVRASSTLPQVCYVFGRYAGEHGIKTVYSIVSDYGPGIDAETWFRKGLEESGGRVVGGVRTRVFETNYAPFLQSAIEARPDAVFSFDLGGDVAVAFMKDAHESGLSAKGIKLLVTGDVVEDNNLLLFGDALKDVVSAHFYQTGLTNPSNKAFLTKFAELFGRDAVPNFRTVEGYDGMALIYQAVTKAKGDLSSTALMAAFKSASVESPRGALTIDPETREAVQTVYIRDGRRVDGKWQNVEIASFPASKDPTR